MIQEPPSKTWIPITVAIIGGFCTIIAAIVSGFAGRIADRLFPPLTPTAKLQAPVETETFEAPLERNNLVINGANYLYPNPSDSPYCIAPEVNTGMGITVEYEIEVPDGWIMVWDFYKAYWNNEQHDSDGLLVITGPWQGNIKIDTGGSCSGPIEWADWIISNRSNAYAVSSRPVFYLGQNP